MSLSSSYPHGHTASSQTVKCDHFDSFLLSLVFVLFFSDVEMLLHPVLEKSIK